MAVTVATLLDEHIWMRPHECVSLARVIWEVLPRDEALTDFLESFATPTELLTRLTIDESGTLTVAPPPHRERSAAPGHRWTAPPSDVVKLIGRTLERLLPLPDAPPSYRVPSRLRLIVQRAAQPLPKADASEADPQEELKPFRSVEEFLGVLRPFEAGDAHRALADLHQRWHACHALGQAVDAESSGAPPRKAGGIDSAAASAAVFERIRRVRETVGVSLDEISTRSKIPRGLLEEFERGDLRNWPKGLFGRQYVREYARESGLDPAGLLRLVEPRLTPDETIDFIRDTWKSAERAGRQLTFHDPSTEGGRYYPEPILEGTDGPAGSDGPARDTSRRASPPAKASPTSPTIPPAQASPATPPSPPPGFPLPDRDVGLGLSQRSMFAAGDERPTRGRWSRFATMAFLIVIAAAFVTLLLAQ